MSSKPLYKVVEGVKAAGRGADLVAKTMMRIVPVDKAIGFARNSSVLRPFKMAAHEPWEGGLISWGPLKIVERIYRSPIGRFLPRTQGGWPVGGLANPLPYRMHYLDPRVEDEDGLARDHFARPLREIVEAVWDSDVSELRDNVRLAVTMRDPYVDETTIAAFTDEVLSIKKELQAERDELVNSTAYTNAMVHMSPDSRERATLRLAHLFSELVPVNKVQPDHMINQHDLEQRFDEHQKTRMMTSEIEHEHAGPTRARHMNLRRWMMRQSTGLQEQRELGLPVRSGGGHPMRAVEKTEEGPQLAEEVDIGMLQDEAEWDSGLHVMSGTSADVWHTGGKREATQAEEAELQQRQERLYHLYQAGEIDTPYPMPMHLREAAIKERQQIPLEQLVDIASVADQQPTTTA